MALPMARKVAAGDVTQAGHVLAAPHVRRALCVAHDRHRPDPAAERRHRNEADEAGRDHARHGANLLQDPRVERFARRHRRVLRHRKLGAQRQDAFRPKARIGGSDREERPDQQTGGHEEHHRGRDLGDHQRRAQTFLAATARPRALTQAIEIRRHGSGGGSAPGRSRCPSARSAPPQRGGLADRSTATRRSAAPWA